MLTAYAVLSAYSLSLRATFASAAVFGFIPLVMHIRTRLPRLEQSLK